ncbi:MAG: FxsA family protein [Cypionkella sp.]
MWVFGLFLVVPFVEIALFVTVGAWLTLWPTLAICLFTGVLGAFLVRWQGLGVLRDIQAAGPRGDPIGPMAHGALILIGGFMLMLPGFFTDAIGFLLMVPAVRRGIIAALSARIQMSGMQMGGFRTGGFRTGPAPDWVDGEYEDVTPDPAPRSKIERPSKWTER